MTHIANCMRPAPHPEHVYITMETSFLSIVSLLHSPDRCSHPMMLHIPRRSKSLKNLQAGTNDERDSVLLLDGSPTLSSQPASSKYQLWPSSLSKSPIGQSRPTLSSDKLSALSMGRSSTSLSDTVVTQETVPFWQRSSSLARRRKVSVPELGSTMATVQEMPIDSRKHPVRTHHGCLYINNR